MKNAEIHHTIPIYRECVRIGSLYGIVEIYERLPEIMVDPKTVARNDSSPAQKL